MRVVLQRDGIGRVRCVIGCYTERARRDQHRGESRRFRLQQPPVRVHECGPDLAILAIEDTYERFAQFIA
jgi:hypothetical protein